MIEYFPNLSKVMKAAEFFSAFIGLLYYNKIKHTYWKYFVYYLIIIVIQESFYKEFSKLLNCTVPQFYAFFGIPIQYLFFIWLYALKSLKNKNLFYVFTFLYLVSLYPLEACFNKLNVVYSLNLTTGTTFLVILIILEFYKQIKNDDVLKFKENKMFYINIGVALFYVGTFPFYAFYNELLKPDTIWIWNVYYLYSLISATLMYTLFSISFVWGKQA